MRIYRGPSQTDFDDDPNKLHKVVDEVDLSEVVEWKKRRARVRANVSKEAHQREAAIRIEFAPSDIQSLHDGLIKSLLEDSARCEDLESELSALKQTLRHIKLMLINPTEEKLVEIKALIDKSL